MSKFTDALNKPLPSKVNNVEDVVTESTETEEVTEEMNTASDNTEVGQEADVQSEYEQEGCEGGACTEDHDHDDDVNSLDVDDIDDDFDDMSDEELAELDAQLSDDALDSVIDGDDDEVSLSPEEEIEADDMMSMAATTLLVNDELSAEEKAEFVESQGSIAVNEGFMSETDVNEIAVESGLVQEAKYTNKMIIRLDAESKKKQLFALAVNVSAAAHGDPDYIKLKKVMKMRKILRAKLNRKYHGEATKRMKIYFNRLKRSKSGMLSKIGNKYNK